MGRDQIDWSGAQAGDDGRQHERARSSQRAERQAVMERPQLTAEIGANVRAARQAKGLALADVAGNAGVSVATLSRIENGKQTVDAALLVVVARIIDTPPAVLLGSAEASTNAETVIAALAVMDHDERRRVIRSAGERRSRKATADELIVDVVADLDAAAEKLVAIKRAMRKSRPRNF